MPKSITVILADTEYTIEQLPMGRSRAWREKVRSSRLMAIFDSLDDAIAEIVKVADDASDQGWQNVNVNELVSLAAIIPTIVQGLMGSIEEIAELLFEYSPELRKDQERIEEEAYDDEAVSAFCEVLKLALPFGGLLGLIRGRRATQTSQNSPSTNGVSGKKKRTAARQNG